MKTKINPTRQELLKLKRRLKIARSGHKLLKEKLEGLMREFFLRIEKILRLEEEIEAALNPAILGFFQARGELGPRDIGSLLSHIPKMEIIGKSRNVMGVDIADYEIKNTDVIKKSCVDIISSNSKLIFAGEKMRVLMDKLVDYAILSIQVRNLAAEIEKNRRRVNSLEYVYIPQMEKSRKYIMQKLEEGERFDRTVLLKLKTLIH